MVVGAEPRGLPGTIIDRIELQRAAEGYPLDDVIVHAHDVSGNAATLEIQVKRGVTFAPSDEVFQKVVAQIAKVSGKTDFWNSRHELGIAISRSSHKINGPYQDVLTWARQLGDGKTFFERIKRPGSANPDMRKFVETLRSHLRAAGAPSDDAIVWKLLGRLHIFVFDFTSTASASEELAKERAVRALHPEDSLRAGELWKILTELAIDVAKSGGDRTRARLLADLTDRSFQLAEARHNLPARQALAETSRYTLDDIGDRVGGVMLTRHEHVSAVHGALDRGRYVEIRGNAGVGKSAVLKHFAEQLRAESTVIALSPARTEPRGLQALGSVHRFDGTAHDLLSDLAGSGSVVLFVDGLDFFGTDERLTVIDLVREAATIRGMSVVVTARLDFGTTEPNWLPSEALDKLGHAQPVIIEELSDDETDELRSAAPQLAALLSDSHPARAVTRNLFRLSRLANRPSEASALRTEAEMAEEWWQSADGARDGGHRERARVLKALAGQALGQADHLSADELTASAVDALVRSESLNDLGDDRVAFRHDVLREWAIGNLLFSEPSLIARLPLDRPAPADLGRGVEMAARLAIERTADIERWRSLYAAVSKTGANESWSRAVLLALVRSEIAVEMLDKASGAVFADSATLLRELIRIVLAVEREPADKFYAAVGIDSQNSPAGINIPVGPSWARLITWLLRMGFGVPAPAVPEVVSLYLNWSIIWGRIAPFTPHIVDCFYYWLSQIDSSLVTANSENPSSPLKAELTSEQVGRLAEDLRTGFLLFCNHRPNLAADYLRSFTKHPYRRQAVEALLKFRGALAQAAPKELAELTSDYLLSKEDDEDEEYTGPFTEAFNYVDLDFVPASPAQGPFYELLLNAPQYGLPLIRRIVDHAVAFKTGGRDFGKNALTVVFPDGRTQVFPWYQSYGFSRDLGAGPSVVASALMALEAWAHGRIEKGGSVDKAVGEVIGQGIMPAAYLLVAVDLLLSHWPGSRTAAVPFLACPELLCLDSQRVRGDNLKMPDIFGLEKLQREPVGFVSLASLKRRPSRRFTLFQLLDHYAEEEYSAERSVLTSLLQSAAVRLGPPQKQSDLGDPEFMAMHALNRIYPKNWREATVQTAEGPRDGWVYVSPPAECEHLKPLQAELREPVANLTMEISIRAALNSASGSSTAFAAAAVKWAQAAASRPTKNEAEQLPREEAIVSAAVLAARDGSSDLVATHGSWIRDTFGRVLKAKEDLAYRMAEGLQHNPIAIAFVGTALLLRNRLDMADVRTLLESAGDASPAAAEGFRYAVEILAGVDERLPRAVLRCAFSGCVRPVKQWVMPKEEHKARWAARQREIAAAIEAELAWLKGKQDEPGWPSFEPAQVHSRHRYSPSERRRCDYRGGRPERRTDHNAAALWLGNAASIFDVSKQPWLRDLARAYSNWTAAANGSDLDKEDDPERIAYEWNRAYFSLMGSCIAGLTIPQIDELALRLIIGLPGEAFLDVTTIFVRSVDNVYFSGSGLGDVEAVHLRTTLARRLMTSRLWEWQCRKLSDSILSHLGRGLAALFFNDDGKFLPAKCYLLEKGIDRLPPFLPLLQELAESGPFLFLATTLLNLLEVSPRPAHWPLIFAAAKSWLAAHPDDKEFWVGQAIGRRVCLVTEAILRLAPKSFATDQPARREVNDVLGKLIRLGVAEAHRLEKAFREIK
jgi:hypothetical protein